MKPLAILLLTIMTILISGCINNSQAIKKSMPHADVFFESIKNQRITSDNKIEWQNFGPGMSGYNEEIWLHPTDTNTLFLGPDMHVSYGSWNGGKSWKTIKDYDGLGLDMKRVQKIRFSHQDPDFGMAIDWSGWTHQTTDRGRTWQRAYQLRGKENDNKGKYQEQYRMSELAVDPTNDNIWYIGAGNFWDIKRNHRSAAQPHGVPFKFSEYGYLLKTSDKGKSWQKISNGLPENVGVGKIVINPKNNQHLVMASSHGIFVSTNGGLAWHKKSNGLPNNLPRDLTSLYNEQTNTLELYLVEQTVYKDLGNTVKSTGGVYKSVDGGENWISITGNLAIDLNKIDYPAEKDRFHKTLGYWFGIGKGQSKQKFTQYPSSTLPVFNRIVINPKNNKEIYITYNKKHDFTFGPGDVWRSVDGGKKWVVVSRHGEYWNKNKNENYWNSRGNPTHHNIEFAHLAKYMAEKNETSGNRTLAINKDGELFIGVDQQTLKSTDRGDTWQQIDDDETGPNSKVWIGRGNSNLPGRFMLHETGIEGRRLLASGEHGLWQTSVTENSSDKQSVAVEQIEGQVHSHGAESVSTMAVHPKDPNTLYVLAWRQNHRGKLRKSTDGGKTWNNISTIFEASNPSYKGLMTQRSLIIDPKNPKNMYFCAVRKPIAEVNNGSPKTLTKGGFGVYKSTDGGYTWALSNNGIHKKASIRTVIFAPKNPNTLFAAASDNQGGLYQSDNNGSNWRKVSIPNEIKAVNNIFIDRNTNQMYLSAGTRTGSYENGGVWRSQGINKPWNKIFKAPYIWQVETSPINSNIIVLSAPGQAPGIASNFMNPGIYLSLDAGETWKKINKNLGNLDKMVDVKPDPYNENVLWSSGWGSGWFVAYINGNNKQGWLKNK